MIALLPTARRNRSGFTMIELILSIGAAALILIVANQVLFTSLRLRNTVSDAIESAAPLELALDSIRLDLQGAVTPKTNGLISGSFRSGNLSSTVNSQPVSLEFNTTTGSLRATEPWGSVQRVSYSLKNSVEDGAGAMDLYRGVCRNLLATSVAEVEDQLLLRDVAPAMGYDRYFGHDHESAGGRSHPAATGDLVGRQHGSGGIARTSEFTNQNQLHQHGGRLSMRSSRHSRETGRPRAVTPRDARSRSQFRSAASVLVVVLWITAGLTALILYFAASMGLELRASANRASDMAAGQAVEGAARYEALTIGESRVWILGRNPAASETGLNQVVFNLQDESGKLNLNRANSNALSMLPGMTTELAASVVDWRSTNGSMSLGYASLGYQAKWSPFETVDELRLVEGITLDHLFGDDRNLNGILDPEERSLTGSLFSAAVQQLPIFPVCCDFTSRAVSARMILSGLHPNCVSPRILTPTVG